MLVVEPGKSKNLHQLLRSEEAAMNKIKHTLTCQIQQIKDVVSQIDFKPIRFKLNRQGSHTLRLADWCREAILFNTKEEEPLAKPLTTKQIMQKALSLEKHLKTVLTKGGLMDALACDNLKDDCRSLRNILAEVINV